MLILIATLFLLSSDLCVLPSLPIMCPIWFLCTSIFAGLSLCCGLVLGFMLVVVGLGCLCSCVSCLVYSSFVVLD